MFFIISVMLGIFSFMKDIIKFFIKNFKEGLFFLFYFGIDLLFILLYFKDEFFFVFYLGLGGKMLEV